MSEEFTIVPKETKSEATETSEPAKIEEFKPAPLSGKTIRVSSSDGQEFVVPIEYAEQSVTIKNMISDFTNDDGECTEVLPLVDVTGVIFQRVIDYWAYHWVHPISPENERELYISDDIVNWDTAYCNVSDTQVFELILAANFLDIKPLLDLCCKHVSGIMRELKTIEEIRERFKIEETFTPEQEAMIMAENTWHLDKEEAKKEDSKK